MTGRLPVPIATRLYSRCIMGGGCWIWTGGIGRGGYGRIYDNATKTTRYAHVISWEETNGPVPAEQLILHSCDTPSCINPRHLFLGTHADNRHDADQKGRSAKPVGETNPAAKLTREQAAAIKVDRRAQRVIAADYGINQQHVSRIKRGERWAHL